MKRNRVRGIMIVQNQEVHKINLQARYVGPYNMVEKVSTVVYVADIDGVVETGSCVNMKHVARTTIRERARRLPHE